MNFSTIRVEAKKLVLLDQTALPDKINYNTYDDYRDAIAAIRRLEVRGAPAIGIAAGYAICLAAEMPVAIELGGLRKLLADVGREIKKARPTAVNLSWAVDRVLAAGEKYSDHSLDEYREALWREAVALHDEDRQMCDAIGCYGAALLPDRAAVLTHCNAGALATGGIGTALAIIYKAVEDGKKIKVYADETRPLLQGARLTCWELMQNGVDVTLIADGAAGYLMSNGKVDAVIVGADRIAQNGDVANKIGTYPLAVMAREHGLPFYVAAPESTFDSRAASGREIVIEERASEEVTGVLGRRVAPGGVKAFNPAFDLTPQRMVTAYITDSGVRPGGRKIQ